MVHREGKRIHEWLEPPAWQLDIICIGPPASRDEKRSTSHHQPTLEQFSSGQHGIFLLSCCSCNTTGAHVVPSLPRRGRSKGELRQHLTNQPLPLFPRGMSASLGVADASDPCSHR